MARTFLLLATTLLIPFTAQLGATAVRVPLDDATFHRVLNEVDTLSLRTALYAFFPPSHEVVKKHPHEAVRELRIADPARAERLLRLARRQIGTGGGGNGGGGGVVVTTTTTNPPPATASIGTTVFLTTTLPTPTPTQQVISQPDIPTPPPDSTTAPAPAPTSAPEPASTSSSEIVSSSSSETSSSTSEASDSTSAGTVSTRVEVVTGDATATAPGVSTAVTVVTADNAQNTASSASESGSLQSPNVAVPQVPLQGAAVGLVGGMMALLL